MQIPNTGYGGLGNDLGIVIADLRSKVNHSLTFDIAVAISSYLNFFNDLGIVIADLRSKVNHSLTFDIAVAISSYLNFFLHK